MPKGNLVYTIAAACTKRLDALRLMGDDRTRDAVAFFSGARIAAELLGRHDAAGDLMIATSMVRHHGVETVLEANEGR